MRRKTYYELHGSGGVMYDIHPNFQQRVKDFLAFFKSKLDEYDELVTDNIIFQNRMKDVGFILKEDNNLFGYSGPTARAAGVHCDIRKKLRLTKFMTNFTSMK